MDKNKSIKYFNNIDSENIQNDDISSLNEKIKLNFYLQNTQKGNTYSISITLIDRKKINFNSENKKSQQNGNLIFDNFYVCDYFFEREQKIQIIINKNNSPIKVDTTLGCIVGSRFSTFIKKYFQEESLIVKAEKIGKNNAVINLKFSLKMDEKNSNYFSKHKLFYLITCKEQKLYSSEEISSEGTFSPIEIPICLLQPFYTFNLYDSHHKLLHTFNKNIDDIKTEPNKLQSKILVSKNNYLYLYDNSEIKENFTFLDYIKAGIRIGLSIGIDFTGSNGHPLDKGTLHSIIDNKPSDYEKAIKACGDILAYYDYDQLFPVYGFGAIINSSEDKLASMCFNLNFENDPDIYTIDNIIKTYHDCLKKEKLTFAGPTEFAPIINKVISKIEKNQLEYHILMILTDGVIDDLQETIDALVKGSFYPLSVIIIGIGDADFKNMEILDGDNVPLISSIGEKRMRDLVQFVPFNKFKNDEKKLSNEVLEEIPRQITEYYSMNNLSPNKVKELLSEKEKDHPSFIDENGEVNLDLIPTCESICLNYNNK